MFSRRPLLFIICISVVLLFARLGAVSVFQLAEARNSAVPVEMMQRGDYIVPYFNGNMRTDKPPLHYYAMLLSYRLAGVSEATARFFSAVCGLGLIIALLLFVKRNSHVATAAGSGLVLLASLHTLFQFRLASPDPYLITFHVLALFCFWEGYNNRRPFFFWLMYFLLGLAVLSKGPAGLLLPGATILVFLLFNRLWRTNKKFSILQLAGGLLLIAVIALPWYWAVGERTNGEWTNSFFFRHNLGRFSQPVDGHKGIFLLTWVFVLAGLFPFSVFLIRAIAYAWKQRKANTWLFFSLVSAATVIGAYSLSATKLINYTVPAYPFLAILVAFFIHRHIRQGAEARKLWPEWVFLSVAAAALPWVGFFVMRSDETLSPLVIYCWLLIVLPLSVLAGLYWYVRDRRAIAFNTLAAGSIVQNLLFFLLLYPAIDRLGSVRKMKGMLQHDRPIAAYRSLNDAFVFYYGRPVPVLDSVNAVAGFLQQHPGALVIEKGRQARLPDSLPSLKMISRNRNLFSSSSSMFYEYDTDK